MLDFKLNAATIRKIVAALLFITIYIIFEKTTGYGYVNFDDDRYILDNPILGEGLTLAGLEWAFQPQQSMWVPLTWISYMIECSFGGCYPAVHHGTNVALHAANTVLLFVFLGYLFQSIYLSGFLSLLWGVHPLRVESVAWIAERKDVLSGFFGLLSLVTYMTYVRSQSASQRKFRYAWVFIFLALSLMSKPMLVTMPAVLYIVDWVVVRSERKSTSLNHRRKIPLAIACITSGLMTTYAWRTGEAFRSLADSPLSLRLENALVSYTWYVYKHFLPIDLAVYYPLLPVPNAAWLASLVALAGITYAFWRFRERYAIAWGGWLWFVVTLVPTLGLLQTGSHARADRFTYLPSIGIMLLIGALIAKHLYNEKSREKVEHVLAWGVAAVFVLSAIVPITSQQLTYWKNSVALFSHAVKVSPLAARSWHNLGEAYIAQGRFRKAIPSLTTALRLAPGHSNTENSLGSALYNLGDRSGALKHFSRANELDPTKPLPWINMGIVAQDEGNLDQALLLMSRGQALAPKESRLLFLLGNVYRERGQINEAMNAYHKAAQYAPQSVSARNNLALLYHMQRNYEEAFKWYRSALQIDSADAEVNNNIGSAYFDHGDLTRAIAHFRRALQSDPKLESAKKNLDIAIERLRQQNGLSR